MKSPLLFPFAALPFLLTACETDFFDRHPHHVAYAVRSDYYYDRDPSYRHPDPRDVAITQRSSIIPPITPSQPYHREVVAAPPPPRPAYRPRAEVRYYSDPSGRYYFQGARRVYSNAGTHYY
jgi:hypothetical protein